MATKTMGQYRFSGNGLVSPINVEKSYKYVGGTTVDDASFQDIQIKPEGGTFKQNTDYYLKVAIPQDMNYELSFDVQLIKTDGSSEELYQFIKNITIQSGSDGNGDNVYNVVLYEYPAGSVKTAIPVGQYNKNTTGITGQLYYEKSNNGTIIKYYYCTGGKNYVEITKFNDLLVAATWRTATTKNYGIFEMTFRPIDSGFTHILFRMVRKAEDYNIQQTDSKGKTVYGRYVNNNNVSYTLYELKNIVSQLTGSAQIPLSRIGVWSHPGLIMVINGEEIRVTANGYYELDVLPITSLAIVARNSADKDEDNNAYGLIDFFTLDYEYEVAEG